MIKTKFRGKVVLVTGHTGFKGSWLSSVLIQLGAKVIGISIDIPTNPSHFDYLNLSKKIFSDNRFDINNYKKTFNLISNYKPDYIFHMAAQPIVMESFRDPYSTFKTNFFGTLNILEILKVINYKCSCVIITSDKSYFNNEWIYGYKEDDRLGGKDPYSGSKASAEMVIQSYCESFFKEKSSNVKIGIGRAGNVIGGGDWADSRIVPDCFKSYNRKKKVIIRSPNSTRPWQHVLEPLSGYLSLASKLHKTKVNCESFNFGPSSDQNLSVLDLIKEIKNNYNDFEYEINESNKEKEAGLLKLNCDKALFYLDWIPTLTFKENIKMTADWYVNFYDKKNKNKSLTDKQIEDYFDLSFERKSFEIL